MIIIKMFKYSMKTMIGKIYIKPCLKTECYCFINLADYKYLHYEEFEKYTKCRDNNKNLRNIQFKQTANTNYN